MPQLLYACHECKADLDHAETVEGHDAHEGQRVHLVDTGPRHADVAAHPLEKGERYNVRQHPRPLVNRPPWLPNHVADQPGPPTVGAAAAVFFTDVSEWQSSPYTDAYPRSFASYRVTLSTTTVDQRVGANAPWGHSRAASGKILGHMGYHVWYPGNEAAQAAKFFATLGASLDDRFVAMIDVESWSGAITGDHSAQITALANALAAKIGQKRVKVYGNSGDLASLYPNRPAWLGVFRAGYSSVPPPQPWQVWQYSDGSAQWPVEAGWPRSDAPFGPTDHNAFLGTEAELIAAFGLSGAPITTSTGEPSMIFVQTVAGTIAAVEPRGKYSLSPNEWACWSLIRKAIPAAELESTMPLYPNVPNAALTNLVELRDDMAQLAAEMTAAQNAIAGVIKAVPAAPTAAQIAAAVDASLPAVPVDVKALAAALAPLLPAGGTVDPTALAQAIAAHLGVNLSAK